MFLTHISNTNCAVDGESSREPPTGASTSNGTSAKPSQRSTTNQRVLPPRANTSSTVITGEAGLKYDFKCISVTPLL